MKLDDIKSRDEYRLVSLIKRTQEQIDDTKERLAFQRSVLIDLYDKASPYHDQEDLIRSRYPSDVMTKQMSVTDRKRWKRMTKDMKAIHDHQLTVSTDIDFLVDEIKDLSDVKRTYEIQLAELRKTDSRTKRAVIAKYKQELKLQEPH